MIEKAFNQSGWFYRFLSRLWDLLVLNFLFLLTSIPIITIGASASALYSVTLKAVRNEESYLVRSYLSAFKENAGKATLLWCVWVAAGIILGVDIFVLGKASDFGNILILGGWVCAIVWMLSGLYLLPLQARFENSPVRTFLNSLAVAVHFLPCTVQLIGIFAAIPMIGIALAFLAPSLVSWYCSLFFFVGFGGTAYIVSFLYRRLFDRLEEKVTKGPIEK